MKNIARKIMIVVVLVIVLAVSSSAGELWDAMKDAASNAATTVKEKGPGWAAAAKDKASAAIGIVKGKAPEVLETVKDKVSGAQKEFSEWNAGQRQEFWEKTEAIMNGEIYYYDPALNTDREADATPAAMVTATAASAEAVTTAETTQTVNPFLPAVCACSIVVLLAT